MIHLASRVRVRAVRSGPLPLVLALGTLASSVASAPSLWAQDEQVATDASTQLFREARQLLNKGRFAEACEKFRASLELRRSPGTWLNVANCLAAEGKLVGALEAFEAALSLASNNPDADKVAAWTAAAREDMAALEPRIPRLTVPAAPEAALRVTLDGQPLPKFGEPLRLDPGRHRLEASAPGKRSFERDFELVEGQAEVIQIPELESMPPELPVSVAPATQASPAAPGAALAVPERAPDVEPTRAPSMVLPWSIIGVGGAVFVGGAVTGVVAAQMTSDLKDTCPSKMCPGDLSAPDRAHTTAVVADVLMVTGLVSVAVGTAWLLMADDGSSPSVAAGCSSTSCGAAVSGRF
jgi:hypothetical protein